MERLRFNLGEVAQARAVVQASELYGPQEAIREYVTNALDTLKEAREKAYAGVNGIVTVRHSLSGRLISINDDGVGMSEDTLRALPGSVWNSVKKGQLIQSGEKGIGLLSFGSIGESADIISRDKTTGSYSHLKFEKTDKGGEPNIVPSFEQISERDVDRFYGGAFERGTRVLVNVNPVHLKGRLSPRALERFLQSTYAPLLMRSDMQLWLEEDNKPSKVLEAPKYNGELLVSKTIPFVAGTRSSPANGSAQVYLLFSPEDDGGSIALHERDVRVWESIAAKEEGLAGMKLWTSPHIHGFINTRGLVLTQDRDEVVRENHGYNQLMESVVAHLEEIHGPEVERRTASNKEAMEQKFVREAYNLLSRGYADSGDPLNKGVRSTSSDDGNGEGGNGHGGNGGGNKGKIKKKRVCPQIPIKVHEFDTERDHLRVRLDEMLGSPIIAVNSAHSAYRAAVHNGSTPHTNYLLGCIAYGIASIEMKDALERQGRFSGSSPLEISTEVHTRAQGIADSSRSKGGKR